MNAKEQNMVDSCLDNFPFERVHKIMEALNWNWVNVDGIPTMFDLKQFARKLLKGTIMRFPAELERHEEACGGFHATVFAEGSTVVSVDLKFVAAESIWDSEWNDL